MSDGVVGAPIKKRGKRYIEDLDVLTAAKDRIRYVLDHFDSVFVAFSGGKDSWALATLVQQVYKEQGRTDKVRLLFRDEEVINNTVADFVMKVHQEGEFDLTWFAYPMNVGMNLMGKYHPFIAWDQKRKDKWHRQPPPWAIRDLGVDTSVLDEYQVQKAELPFLGAIGNTCIMLGIRAAESLKRFMGLTHRVELNWLSGTGAGGWATASPLFDWEEQDIFKWFYDADVGYCPIYDSQMWVNTTLRVSSSLHDRSFEQLVKLREAEPEYWAALSAAIPELDAHARYSGEIDYWMQFDGYPKTWEGLKLWIDQNLSGDFHPMAHAYVASAMATRSKLKDKRALGGVPLRSIVMDVIRGKYWGGIVTLKEPKHEDYVFEGLAI